MSSQKKNKLANTFLAILQQRPRKQGWETIPLCAEAGLDTISRKGADTADRMFGRGVLKELHAAGKVTRNGVGSFRWSIAVESWDPANPFAKAIQKPTTPPPSISMNEFPFEGYTYPHKEVLKRMGCHWSGTGSLWYAPNKETQDAAINLIGGKKDKELENKLTELAGLYTKKVEECTRLKNEIETIKADADKGGQFKKIKIVNNLEEVVATLTDVTLPSTFQDVLDLAVARRPIFLVGPAGCGKTYLARLVSESLNLPFGILGCTASTTENHLFGKQVPNITKGTNEFQSTEFLDCYENGGVFLLDEMDAADSNVLLSLNSAIANGYCSVPNRPEKPRAKKHKNFVIIGTANTFGRGANRTYAGRNQLDGATLDRFQMGTIECDYEKGVEFTVCPDDEIRHRLQTIRANVVKHGLRRIVSTRFLEDAYLMKKTCKWDLEKIVSKLVAGWTEDEKTRALAN